MKQWLYKWTVYLFYISLRATWRVKLFEPPQLVEDLKNKVPLVFAIWHGDEYVMISQSERYPLCTMTSISKDGEAADFLLRKLGMQTARGSSSKKAISGLKSLLKLSKKGLVTVFAVDGPRGPYHQIKPGVFEVASLMRAKIYVAGVASEKRIVFKKAWNKAYLPLPFSKVSIAWSDAYTLPEGLDPREASLKLDLLKKFDASANHAAQILAGRNLE
jgi:lysophospholipid acyltransferase (LPLAT)-like uncharacterized protein